MGVATSSWRRSLTGSGPGAASVSAHAWPGCTSCRAGGEVQVNVSGIHSDKSYRTLTRFSLNFRLPQVRVTPAVLCDLRKMEVQAETGQRSSTNVCDKK